MQMNKKETFKVEVEETWPAGKNTCPLCLEKNVTDLSHGHGKPRIVCHKCKAQYWRKWYSWEEWEEKLERWFREYLKNPNIDGY